MLVVIPAAVLKPRQTFVRMVLFRESSSSEFSMSIDAGSAYSGSNEGGVGQWKLSFDGTNPVLVLNYNDGQTAQYVLTYIDKKTYLNDTRYFVLFNEEGPGCY